MNNMFPNCVEEALWMDSLFYFVSIFQAIFAGLNVLMGRLGGLSCHAVVIPLGKRDFLHGRIV